MNISGGDQDRGGTRIGDHNYLMAFAHVGHDCIVGDHNIFANTATLGGHVELEDHIFLSGHMAMHQFCRIGSFVMIAGVSGVTQDVPHFILADGQRPMIFGLNLVGLSRNGFTQEQRNRIKPVYHMIL